MRQRIDAGSILALVGAALLVASLFVRWFDPAGTGWQVFELVDLLLAGIAIAIVAALFGPARGSDDAPVWVPALALAALVIVAANVIDPPPAARGMHRDTGAWLALGGAFLLAAGALLRRSRISVSVDVRQRETRRRVPAVDRREEPAAGGPPPAPPPGPVRRDPQRTQPLEALDPDDRPREG